jgi:transcriptional regulator with XRE-family HTH domain
MQAVKTPEGPFGVMLRDWRERRRLTQLELSLQSDVSARHLSFLETGRSRPSRDMVLHLSEELDVPLRARNELLVAAGFAPAFSSHRLEDGDMAEVAKAVRLVLQVQEPFPAIVVDQNWDIVAGNRGAALFTDLLPPQLREPPVNAYRVSFHPDGLPRWISNFDEYADHLIWQLRRQVAQRPKGRLPALLDEATRFMGNRRIEAATQPVGVVLPIKLKLPEQEVSLFSTISLFGAPLDVTLDELAIEAFFPADAASEAYLRARFGRA